MAVNELLAQLHEVAVSPKKQLEKYLAEGKKEANPKKTFLFRNIVLFLVKDNKSKHNI